MGFFKPASDGEPSDEASDLDDDLAGGGGLGEALDEVGESPPGTADEAP